MNLLLLGSRIKAERKRCGFTLEVLSEKVGISRNYLWEIESGRKAPALSTLYSLGITLDVSIDYLLGVSTERRSISSVTPATERELEIARIMEALNECETGELSLILDVISDLLIYLAKK